MVLNIPVFLKRYFVKDIDPKFCIYVWPEKWMLNAYFLAKFAFVVIPLMLMVGSYSRVVYNLWFKRNDDNELTYQQQVSIDDVILSFVYARDFVTIA